MEVKEIMNNVQPMNTYFAQQYSLWKKTGKKKYEIWFATPPIGTKFYNELEDAHYTIDERNRAVLSGTVGEPWTTSLEKIAKTYTFATGESITPESLERHRKLSPDGWMKVATQSGTMTNYAMFLDKNKFKNIPIAAWGSILIANREGVKHGDGDYLVCGMNQDGSPNFNDMWVVNGRVFPATYNCQNFSLSVKAKQTAAAAAPRPTVNTKPQELLEYKPYVEQIVVALRNTGKLKITAVNHDTKTATERERVGNYDCWQIYFNNDRNVYLHVAFFISSEDITKYSNMWVQCNGTTGDMEEYFDYENIHDGRMIEHILPCFGYDTDWSSAVYRKNK